jgi:hypothetical protein
MVLASKDSATDRNLLAPRGAGRTKKGRDTAFAAFFINQTFRATKFPELRALSPG